MEIQSAQPAPTQPPRNRFEQTLQRAGIGTVERDAIGILQINVGKRCNQACTHCHVEAGPKRTEVMERPVVERLLALAAHPQIHTVDLTGGAPEMNPHFRHLVESLAALGKTVLVRCNLTIVEEPGYHWLVEFYAANQVHLVCSLPCYTPENVDRQRGRSVFERSIAALRKLNAVGYGAELAAPGAGPSPRLLLDLVYNPGGASLPGSQAELEADYKRELGTRHGVRFNRLLTLANLPIGRFAHALARQGALEPYLQLLEDRFNAETVPGLMCRNTLNVGWDGQLYDCDFNQMLALPLGGGSGRGGPDLFDTDFSLERLRSVPVRTGQHCLGCTAGAGSSCGGALA